MIVDYSTFTEVDPNSHLALVGTNHLDFDAYYNEDCYLYKDYGVGYFGDFTHKVDVRLVADTAYQNGFSWVLANDIDDWFGLDVNSKTAIGINFVENAAPVELVLHEIYGGTGYTDAFIPTVGTWYYLTITKSGTSLTCKIYSDSARTNLVDTLSLILHLDHKFRYLFGCNSYNSGNVNQEVCTLDIENLFISPFYTTIARVKKRVKHLSSSLTDIDINENIQRAEGFIDFTMRASGRGSSPDFIFDAVKHSAIRQCCTDLAAFYTMSYNPGGTFLTLANAQMTANLLWDAAERTLLKLADPRSVEYLKGL